MVALLSLGAEIIPRTLAFDPPLTDDEFEDLCLRQDFIQFERTSEGAIRMNAPAGGLTGRGNIEILRQLANWWETHQRGSAFDSNTGFFLPDGSMLSPDAAYVTPEQIEGLANTALTGFPRLCPAFVMELLSATDSLAETQRKMEVWIANGSQLAWLVDPYRKNVLVYQPGSPSLKIETPQIAGSGPVEGFTLDLTKVWRRY